MAGQRDQLVITIVIGGGLRRGQDGGWLCATVWGGSAGVLNGPAVGGEHVADVPDVVIAALDAQAVASCLAALPERQRLCIVLMDLAGYTAREAAKVRSSP